MIGSGKNQSSGLAELKQRLWFVLWGLIVFRIGAHIPVPGINSAQLAEIFANSQNSIIGMAGVFSGGALQRLSLFALGIMPYISASIIMQLMTVIVPSLEQLKKEGEMGRRKISQYTRVGTLLLATFQAFGMSKFLVSSHATLYSGFLFHLTTVVTLVTGTMFLMWLGEKITERGVGNGISLIIFAGIASGLPSAIGNTFDQVRQGNMNGFALLALLLVLLGITAFVVFVERGQRRITVNYAKRQQGRKMYAAQQSHLPLKINMAGVIPPIFASSLILFPASISQWFSGKTQSSSSWLAEIGLALQPGQPLYILLFASGIIFFCFFYTALVFNPKETADNLKRSGAFVPGIRPGDQTASYIDTVMTRLTLVGALYITAISILPEFLVLAWKVPFYFGGTSLLIIVVVIMDFIAQIQAHLMSQQYESLMRKANLKGRNGGPGGFGLFK
ncbi:preprotein translocase subunit SecY [Candidatus Berkiella aquae]|uniref:Protein translocase subunit SecY n=1 Tax=Candidatus Berkiella aquae TaxID=295108 RepID=A0A0Q9YPQ5_9GAMM|nr:preprotein translocase subunit SecY [Candidatus Berkiella aquae]MCS5710284.1 preprotein translocase subunit SecY [Candidatus Berkiella aquae]